MVYQTIHLGLKPIHQESSWEANYEKPFYFQGSRKNTHKQIK